MASVKQNVEENIVKKYSCFDVAIKKILRNFFTENQQICVKTS